MKVEINNTTKHKIDTKVLKKAADLFGQEMNVADKEVSAAFVSPKQIRSLNKQYLGIDKVTDVLAFPESIDDKFFGEVVMCYTQIIKQAQEQGAIIKDELTFIFIHGLLHLLGYSDNTEKERLKMEKLSTKLCKSILNKFTYISDSAGVRNVCK